MSVKFWTEDIRALYQSFDVLPNHGTIPERYNALTRLSLIVSIVVAVFDPRVGVILAALSLVVIVAAFNSGSCQTAKCETFCELPAMVSGECGSSEKKKAPFR